MSSFCRFSVALLAIAGALQAQTLTSTTQGGTLVQATGSDAFVDSIGFGCQLTYDNTPYVTRYQDLKTAISNLGIRHVRSGGTSSDYIAKIKDLAASGVTTEYVMAPFNGIAPNANYWVNPPGYMLTDFLKKMVGPGVVEAVEMPNELDVFYQMYRWHPKDKTTLSADPKATNYFGLYGQAITKDSWKAIKSDPATSSVKIIGPTIAYTYPNPYPTGSLYAYVDYGAFHPYANNGNTWSYPQPYDSVQQYFWQTNQPSVNIDENPYQFTAFAPPFTSGSKAKPMLATETGYFTGTGSRSVSETTQAKYTPRVFAEYFRHGIPRTFMYEFLDEGTDLTNSEQNFGIVRNDMTPKPAYIALQSLIALLREPGAKFTPSSLTYKISAQPNGQYTRTQYVHDLLLQKSSGDYYLLLWHEISNASFTDASGNNLSTTTRELNPPALTTTVTLPAGVRTATLYSYNSSWQLVPRALSIQNGQVTLQAGDSISVLKLSSTAPAVTVAKTGTQSSVSLTSPQIADWSHWASPNASGSAVWDSKAGVPSSISDFQVIGNVQSNALASIRSPLYSWSDSKGPNASTSGTRQAPSVSGRGNGFSMVLTSQEEATQFDLFVGAHWATGSLAVEDTNGNVLYSDTSLSDSGAGANARYRIELQPTSSVVVKWTVHGGSGSVQVQAATLSNPTAGE